MRKYNKTFITVVVFCSILMIQIIPVALGASSSYLNVKLSDYTAYIDGVKLPVYSVNGNLMINLNHLNYYGFKVSSSDTTVLCYRDASRQITGIPKSQWATKYNVVSIKPRNKCYLNGKEIPVLYLNNQPFIFLNELYEDNIVKVNGKNVNITLGIVDGLQKTQKSLEQMDYMIKILNLDTDITEYSVAYIYYDPITKLTMVNFADNVLDIFEEKAEKNYTLLQMYVVLCKHYPEGSYTQELYINEDWKKWSDYYIKQDYINKLKFIYSLYQKANGNSPVYVIGAEVKEASIGYPQAELKIFNFSAMPIDAVEVSFKCYNLFDQPALNESQSNQFVGIKQKISIPAFDSSVVSFDLTRYPSAGKIKNVLIRKVHFIDNKIWINPATGNSKKL
ncbi:hypothetical protein [Caldicellulosiruptor acetigenus]|uniref:Copper amine oxidase domain protein n=1 Tax=Caldicellulosiruptor acetigenus 6A TaxID=632516 RepID=G2PYK7_9FIRM|nr:hypothetical protein [Caldicellulosiruptor acetigenus]AEM74926.1 hypothetical protein Calla_2399 [Caldicellulosiruptor acetigenus 6A]